MSRHQEQTQEDLKRLHEMLARVVQGEGRPGTSKGPADLTRILDLACGACNEAEVLTEFFASLKGGMQPSPARPGKPGSDTRPPVSPGSTEGGQVHLTGMDIRAREIADAQRRFRKGSRPRVSDAKAPPVDQAFEFLTGDASRLDQHRELGDDFDVVFLRHQNLYDGRRTWEEIFDQALRKLGPEGRLVITSYFDEEHQLASDVIERLGGELIRTERNPDSRELATPGKSVDRHLAVFRRKE